MTGLDLDALHGLSPQLGSRLYAENRQDRHHEIAGVRGSLFSPSPDPTGLCPRELARRILGLCLLVSLSLPIVEATRMPDYEELRDPLRAELAGLAAWHARLELWPTLEELPRAPAQRRWIQCREGVDGDELFLTGRRFGRFKTGTFMVLLRRDTAATDGSYLAVVRMPEPGSSGTAHRFRVQPDEAGLLAPNGRRLTRRRVLAERCSRSFGHEQAIRRLALELTVKRDMKALRRAAEEALARHRTRWWPRVLLLWLDISEGRCEDLARRTEDLAPWFRTAAGGIEQQRRIEHHARQVHAIQSLDGRPRYRLHSEDAAVLESILGGSIVPSTYDERSLLVEAPR